MKYRKLSGYKYQIMEDMVVQTDITPSIDLRFEFIELSSAGKLLIKKGYAWDGVTSFPRTPKILLRGSLVHDALYQLMRLGGLDYKKDRIFADKILQRIIIEDGVSEEKAKCIYEAVRLVGEIYAKQTTEPEVVIYEFP